MLTSQRPHNIRNIASTAPRPVQVPHTKPGLMERLGELDLHDLMAKDAPRCNARMRTTGWKTPNANRQKGSGQMGPAQRDVLAFLAKNPGWHGSAEIAKTSGRATGVIRNALTALVIDGKVEKDTVSRGKGFGGGQRGAWRIKEDAQ